MNRALIQTVRAMLSDSQLTKGFWAIALLTAAYLPNRSSPNAVKGMTPYKAWTNEKPNIKHINLLSCTVPAMRKNRKVKERSLIQM